MARLFSNYSGGLLSLVDEGEGVVTDVPEMTPVEEIQAQADEQEFNDEQGDVETKVEALESMEQVLDEGEAQVVQNEVNQAALEGEAAPAAQEGEAVTVTTEEGAPVVTVQAEEVPAPTIDQNSTPAEVGVEAIKLNNKLTNFAARLRMNSAEDMKAYLGVTKGFGGGLESIMSNPMSAYKEGCEGFKDTLVKYKNKVIAFLQKIGQTIVKWFRKFVNACKMTKKRAKSLKEKIKAMDAKDYKVSENSKLPGAVAWVYGYDKTGKNYIKERVKHVDETIMKIKEVARDLLKGHKEPKDVDQEAIKKFGASDGVGTKLLGFFKSLISGGQGVKTEDMKIFIPVDNEKAYTYAKYDGNSDSMDSFPKLIKVSVKQPGKEEMAGWFTSEAAKRIDVAMNLCNSIISESDAVSSKMDDASKLIDTFKKDIENLVKAGNAEGEGMHKRNYAVRRSITVSSDLFKLSYIYGVIPSQALTAAFGLISSIEKK